MGLVAGPEDVMSVETGSSIMTVRGRHLPSSVLTLKLHEEDWVLRKVRKGKLGLGSVKRGRDPATSVAVTRSPIVTSMYIPIYNNRGRYLR